MNIGVNTRLLLPNKLEGIGRFTLEILKRVVLNHPEHQFYFFFDRSFDSQFVFADNITPVVIHPQARHPILYKIWFDYSISKALKKHNIDVFLSPDGFLSKRTKIPQIAVVHDLNFEHYPEDLPKKDANYYKNNFPHYAELAGHIITVSEFSKGDIVRQYGVNPDKISVAYNAAGELFAPIKDKTVFENRYDALDGYFIYVGALHSRKNIVRMLQAFDLYKTNSQSSKKLVIVGQKLFKSPEIESAYNQLKSISDIIFTGRLPDQDLANTIASSSGMIYVSYFEGFGIPIIEAFKCGVPVLTSNVTSLPEVGGNLAIYADPFDVKSIAHGIQQLEQSEVTKEELIARANLFNWDNSAEVVWNAIENQFK
ncbi:MAG: glycosyltransferase involved in cell wall biosynthesis [Flavobacteriales bacterium]